MSAVPKKIAILGGGMGALSTAFHLTNQKDWKQRYEITIYTLGYRLGGKVAQSRNEHAADRIEEHGIHIFANYYHNVFSIIHECCKEIDWEGLPVNSIDQLFKPNPWVMYMDYFKWNGKENWTNYMLEMNKNKEIPWEGTGGDAWKASDEGIIDSIFQILGSTLFTYVKPENDRQGVVGFAIDTINFLTASVFDIFKRISTASFELALGSVARLWKEIKKWVVEGGELKEKLQRFVDFFRKVVQLLKNFKKQWMDDPNVRRIFVIFDFYSTLIFGCLADKVFEETTDIDELDEENYITWLLRHEIDPLTMQTPTPHMAANVCFQYRRGDTNAAPNMSTAGFLLFCLRFLFGKGAYMYHFLGGTGDCVVYPIYIALKKRGVNFRFFTKVDAIEMSTDQKSIARVHLTKQVKLSVPEDEYNPLRVITLDNQVSKVDSRARQWTVWRDGPNVDQIVKDQADHLRAHKTDLESWWADWPFGEKQTMEVGTEFDHVVLAISIGALKYICKDIVAKKPNWERMIKGVTPIRTFGAQIWIKKDLAALGFDPELEKRHSTDPKPDDTTRPRASKLPISTGYPAPLFDIGDFADTIPWEGWHAPKFDGERPKACLYFCAAMRTPDVQPDWSDHQFPIREKAALIAQVTATLQSTGGAVLFANNTPSYLPSGFDFEHLSVVDRNDPDNFGTGKMLQQFFKANIDPTELYVPGFTSQAQNRKHAWESEFENMTLAGDWIYCGFNLGSIEAAGMSGALASYALTGTPNLEDISGYFYLHPKQRYNRATSHPFPNRAQAARL